MFTGSLLDFNVTDVLQLIKMQRKDGLLIMVSRQNTVALWCRNGDLVFADDSDRPPVDTLGQWMIRDGLLDRKTWNQARDRHLETGQPIDSVLVATGKMSLGAFQALALHYLRETVFSLFRWLEGDYSFETETSLNAPLGQPLPPINTEDILMEAAHRAEEWPFVDTKIPSMNAIFALTDKGKAALEDARGREAQTRAALLVAVRESPSPTASAGAGSPSGEVFGASVPPSRNPESPSLPAEADALGNQAGVLDMPLDGPPGAPPSPAPGAAGVPQEFHLDLESGLGGSDGGKPSGTVGMDVRLDGAAGDDEQDAALGDDLSGLIEPTNVDAGAGDPAAPPEDLSSLLESTQLDDGPAASAPPADAAIDIPGAGPQPGAVENPAADPMAGIQLDVAPKTPAVPSQPDGAENLFAATQPKTAPNPASQPDPAAASASDLFAAAAPGDPVPKPETPVPTAPASPPSSAPPAASANPLAPVQGDAADPFAETMPSAPASSDAEAPPAEKQPPAPAAPTMGTPQQAALSDPFAAAGPPTGKASPAPAGPGAEVPSQAPPADPFAAASPAPEKQPPSPAAPPREVQQQAPPADPFAAAAPPVEQQPPSPAAPAGEVPSQAAPVDPFAATATGGGSPSPADPFAAAAQGGGGDPFAASDPFAGGGNPFARAERSNSPYRGEPGEHEDHVLLLVDGERDVNDLMALSRYGGFETCKALAVLVDRGLVQLVGERSSQVSDVPTEEVSRVTIGKAERRPVGPVLLVAGCYLLLIVACATLFTSRGSHHREGDAVSEFLASTAPYRDYQIRQLLGVYRMMHGTYPEALADLRADGLVGYSKSFDGLRYSRVRGGYTLHVESPAELQ